MLVFVTIKIKFEPKCKEERKNQVFMSNTMDFQNTFYPNISVFNVYIITNNHWKCINIHILGY